MRPDFLRTLLPYKKWHPSHDTVGKLLAVIDHRQFGEAFEAWTKEVLESIPEFVGIEEKGGAGQ